MPVPLAGKSSQSLVFRLQDFAFLFRKVRRGSFIAVFPQEVFCAVFDVLFPCQRCDPSPLGLCPASPGVGVRNPDPVRLSGNWGSVLVCGVHAEGLGWRGSAPGGTLSWSRTGLHFTRGARRGEPAGLCGVARLKRTAERCGWLPGGWGAGDPAPQFPAQALPEGPAGGWPLLLDEDRLAAWRQGAGLSSTCWPSWPAQPGSSGHEARTAEQLCGSGWFLGTPDVARPLPSPGFEPSLQHRPSVEVEGGAVPPSWVSRWLTSTHSLALSPCSPEARALVLGFGKVLSGGWAVRKWGPPSDRPPGNPLWWPLWHRASMTVLKAPGVAATDRPWKYGARGLSVCGTHCHRERWWLGAS